MAGPAEVALAADPTLVGLGWVVAVGTIMAALTAPLRSILKKSKNEEEAEATKERAGQKAAAAASADMSKSSAEAVLYQHLSEQVTAYREIAHQATKERNALVERIAKLEADSETFAETKKTMAAMGLRLSEQDAQIQKLISDSNEERSKFLDILQAKDAAITRRDERIEMLERGQRELEARIQSDEVLLGCPFHKIGAPDNAVPHDEAVVTYFKEQP